VHQIVHALYQMKVQSVLVEGGAKLLQSFIDENLWDEVRTITNEELIMEEGIAAPAFQAQKITTQRLLANRLDVFKPIPQA
ncbi:MAG TPA: dihydrofolate reductase family protein, partial [Chitinophagaceae bacterium]|nr:dihydrofolate reductase family protein [Chitinophagaceae bacterium]